MTQRPTLASNIWPHLKTDKEPAQPQRRQNDLASAMYPSLPRPKPPPHPLLPRLKRAGES
jgi:hypothetical protein